MGYILYLWTRISQNRHVRKITGSKITTFYACLAVCYCAIQIIFLAATWQVNHGAGRRLETMVMLTGNGTHEFTFLDYDSGKPEIRLCPGGITQSRDMGDQCPIIWPVQSSPQVVRASTGESKASGAAAAKRSDQSITLLSNKQDGSLTVSPFDGFKVNGVKPTSDITLDSNCVQAIKWPYHHLLMIRREDVVAVCYQGWLLFMSFTALMTESIPHIGASFFLHVIALGWSAFQIWATQKFESDYRFIITGPQGACAGIDLISDYFKARTTFQIGTAVINFVSLIASTYLCWRLVDRYGWATFKKMGASRSIARAYKAALVLSICIQLSIFFYIASVGSWLDEISKGILGAHPNFRMLYLVGFSVATALVIPWLYLAWFGIRRESKRLMSAFFVLSICYLVLSGLMLNSNTFIQTFKHWAFIGAAFSVSWGLILATTILSIICSLNFGIGLPYYLKRQHEDDFDEDFHPTPDEKSDDLEKVVFPSASSDEDAVVIAFPENSPVYLKRTESANSQMSIESRGSTRLPPLKAASSHDLPRIMIPQPPNVILGRNLTQKSYTTSSFSPSWTPGDDKAMMANHKPLKRFDSASSFGNLDSAQLHPDLDRDFSFGTQASSDVFVPVVTAPKRTATASSKMSSVSASSGYSTFSSPTTPSRKKRLNLADEL